MRARVDRNLWRTPVGQIDRLHAEITAGYNDMICAATREEIETRWKAFIRKWRLKRAIADSLQEVGWALFASEQTNVRKVDGWKTLATKPIDQPIDLAA